MTITAKLAGFEEIRSWRDLYRAEMNCQIVHDNMHYREGWTLSYRLELGQAPLGYGSILIGGPWKGTRTIFEFFVLPQFRNRVFDAFECLLSASGADAFEIQSSETILNALIHARTHKLETEKIVFEDCLTTAHSIEGAVVRQRGEPHNDWSLEAEGKLVAWGGILYHYNRPYGDIYMEVAEPHRRKGYGAYLVQELKRICYEGGSIPAARCNPDNIASGKTLQKAGFAPCALILVGKL
jgi:GNAT superfamily N-acetyltransferase